MLLCARGKHAGALKGRRSFPLEPGRRFIKNKGGRRRERARKSGGAEPLEKDVRGGASGKKNPQRNSPK